LSNGDFVLTWSAYADASNTTGILSRRFDASLNPLGSETFVNATKAGTQDYSSVDNFNNGGYIVSWLDTTGVRYQRFNADSSVNGGEVLVSSNVTSSGGYESKVKVFPDNSYIVSWVTGGVNPQVQFQRFSATGVTLGSVVTVAPSGKSAGPDIAILENGGFVMSWLTLDPTTSAAKSIVTQVFDSNGVQVGSPNIVAPSSGTPTYSTSVHVVALKGGGYALSYIEAPSNHYEKVFAAPGGSFLSGATAGGTDNFTGGDGADVITANGGADVIYAGAGNDTVIINADNITQLATAANMVLDGGSGINTLKIDGTGQTLDLTNATIAAKVSNFSVIDLTGTGNNTLKLNAASAKFLSGASDNTLTAVNEAKLIVVNGNSGDAVELLDPKVGGTSQWSAGLTETGVELIAKLGAAQGFVSGQSYKAYTLAGVTVYINTALTFTNTAVNGGSTAFSAATDTVGIVVTNPLFATVMNVELFGINPSLGGIFASYTGAPAYVAGGTTTLHNGTTDAVVQTRNSWDGGGFSNNFLTTGIVVGQKYYIQLPTQTA
jgi:hypothetical protein